MPQTDPDLTGLAGLARLPTGLYRPITLARPGAYRGYYTSPPAVRGPVHDHSNLPVTSATTRDGNPENTTPASPDVSHVTDRAMHSPL